MAIKIRTKTTIELFGTHIKVGELREALQGHDAHEQVAVRYSPGYPRDQREYDTVSLEIGG